MPRSASEPGPGAHQPTAAGTPLPAAAHPRGGLAAIPSPALVVGGIASVQFGSAVATHLFATVGPGGAVLLRLLGASIVLTVITRPRLRGRSRRQWLLAALFGVVLSGLNTSFYEALDRIPLGIAVTIEFIGPLAVGLIGSRRPRDLVWIALAGVGIVVLMHGSAHGLNAVGVVFALSAAVFWAAYIFVSARVGQAYADGAGLMIAMWVSVLATLPVGLVEGGGHLLRPHALVLGLAVGILSSALPYSLEMEALRRIATHVFGVLMSLEPAVAAFAGWLALGQQLSARELAGIVLVIIASVGVTWTARTRAAPPVSP